MQKGRKSADAGHTMQHELEVAIAAKAPGSIDANTGDLRLGWDTDQFPTNANTSGRQEFLENLINEFV